MKACTISDYLSSLSKARFTSACEWNVNDACGREPRQNVWYIRTLFGIRRGSESTLHKRIVCEFLLMYRRSTDRIRLFAECSSHSWMLFTSPRWHIYIERSLHFWMSCSRSVCIPMTLFVCLGILLKHVDYLFHYQYRQYVWPFKLFICLSRQFVWIVWFFE